jgi:hypothetical protein
VSRRLGFLRVAVLLVLAVLVGVTVVIGTSGIHWTTHSSGGGPVTLIQRSVLKMSPIAMIVTLAFEVALGVAVWKAPGRRRASSHSLMRGPIP